MEKLEIRIEDFLSIKKAHLLSHSNMTILLGPNCSGKSQILQFLYSLFSSMYIFSVEEVGFDCSRFKRKLRKTLLVSKDEELIRWGSNKALIKLKGSSWILDLSIIRNRGLRCNFKGSLPSVKGKGTVVFYYPPGFGDYYKGIFSLKKYYSGWSIVSEAISDFVYDLLTVSGANGHREEKTVRMLEIFEDYFQAKFYVQNQRIYIQEKGRKYKLERSASGLKSLSGLYLMLRYGLLENILLIDEPESSLHPTYIEKLARFLLELSNIPVKIFVATHSDYFLQKVNALLNKGNFSVDVWEGRLGSDGAHWRSYVASREKLIDTSPLTSVYLKLVEETYGAENSG